MLVLLHALIPCLAAYILSPSPVLLHIYCTCFSYFLVLPSLHPSTFNGNVFTPFSHCFFVVDSLAHTMLFALCASPTHFAARGHVKRT